MTTPTQDAPLVFPAVAFRPVRLFVISLALTAAATAATAYMGRPALGAFFGVGLLLGLLNALLVRRSVESITSREHPLKSSMAINSASRIAVITVLALAIAFYFRPEGLGVLFGLAIFQVLLVVATALPVWKKLRTGDPDGASADGDGRVLTGSEGTEGRSASDD
ncbi:ATP synthase subunit I [Mycobacterium sp.]|uniref:ATP synthase subunit I n=1 Tax=Mycobacterium sp. TaxID=1785 RepID=UPI003A87D38D